MPKHKPGERGYKERGIEKDIEAFCGWRFLLRLVEASPTLFDRFLISGLFLTGCRVSELIRLRRRNFNLDFHPEIIAVEHVPVIKRYSRKKKQRYEAYRSFPIKIDEPLVSYFLEGLRHVKDKLYPVSRTTVFLRVRKVGRILNSEIPFSNIHSSQLYPHWFRSQRARQLRHDYKFTDEELRDWFGWKYSENRMPAVYGRSSIIELAEKMGVKIGYY